MISLKNKIDKKKDINRRIQEQIFVPSCPINLPNNIDKTKLKNGKKIINKYIIL